MTLASWLGLLPLLVSTCERSTHAATAGSPALPADTAGYVDYAVTNLPAHFGPGSDVDAMDNTPADNPITDAGATLGRVLFYDQRLSHNNSTSCSSCHRQEHGFTDPDQLSVGFDGELTDRRSMGLSNAKFYENGRFFWDERAATLEDQVLGPIQNEVEMGTDLNQLRSELAATNFYPVLFTEAYGTAEITDERISKALAQFVRSMVSYQSKLDTALSAGEPGTAAFENELTSQELLGREVFHGSGRCNQCHESDAQVATKARNIGLDLDNSADEGAGDGRFKVPSLRNIEVRDGFMHDGRFATLEEVIDFYSTGIKANPNLENSLRTSPGGPPMQFNFTQTEKDALIAYLLTLTDPTLLTSDLFSDPFVELPGDFDDSGLVDGSDIAFWESDQFVDSSPNPEPGMGAYLILWQRNLGQSWQDLVPPSAQGAVANVPEPTAAALLFWGCGAVAVSRLRGLRRRRASLACECGRLS